jgi:hypothetical protein
MLVYTGIQFVCETSDACFWTLVSGRLFFRRLLNSRPNRQRTMMTHRELPKHAPTKRAFSAMALSCTAVLVAACQPAVPVTGSIFAPHTADSSAPTNDISTTDTPLTSNVGPTWPADPNPPTVTITNPPDNAQIGASHLELKGVVKDDTGIAAVTVAVGFNIPIPLQTAADGSFSQQLALNPGTQKIVVAAHDISGNVGKAEVTVTRDIVNEDTAPPTLNIAKPTTGFTVFGDSVRVEGTATDDTGVAEVRVKLGNGGLQLAQTQNAFATFWLDAQVTDGGAQEVTVIARDVLGKVTQKIIIGSSEKIFDASPPTLSITSPANNFSTTSPTVTVIGTAHDGSGVVAVDVKVGSGPYQPVTNTSKLPAPAFSAWMKTAKLLPGVNIIKVRARDATGLVSSAQVTVNETSGTLWSPPQTIALKWLPASKPELVFSLDRVGLGQLFTPDKAAQIVMMKLDVSKLVRATFAQIRNACGLGWQKPNKLESSCPKAWGQPERNLWRLITMTPANANVTGTSIASMAGIAKGLSQYGLLDSFHKILAAALGIGTESLIVGEKAVAESLIANLIATHPNALPDGRLPITLQDALSDLKTVGARFDAKGAHPGFLDAKSPPHSVLMTKDFKITMTATSNLAWHDGVALQGKSPTKSYIALVHDTLGPTFDDVLEFEFLKPGKFAVTGLAANPTTAMTMRVEEAPGWAKTGTSINPLPKGNGGAWQVKPWLLERVLVDASYRQYKSLRRGCDYCKSKKSGALLYESLFGLDVAEIVVGRQGYRKSGSGGPSHFSAINPNPAGWMRTWTLLGLGSPPPPQYVWDMVTEVSQRRLLDGGVKQGQGHVRFSLPSVPVGITSDGIKKALVPQMHAQKSKLSALLMGSQGTNAALEFWLAKGADKENRLYFVAPTDPVPAATNKHAKRGFFANTKLSNKLSSTASGGSGDTVHEKLSVGDAPKTVYCQNSAGVLHQIRIEESVGDEVVLVARRWIGGGAP